MTSFASWKRRFMSYFILPKGMRVMTRERHMLNRPGMWTASWMNSFYWPKGNMTSCSASPGSEQTCKGMKPIGMPAWLKRYLMTTKK